MRRSDLLASTALATFLGALAAPAHAVGIFAPPAGQPGSTAVAASSSAIKGWATSVVDYTPGSNVDAGFQTPDRTLGAAGNSNGANIGFIYDIASLGRGGHMTLGFGTPIANGPGYDFAVFENSFNDTFLELAYVEVSSDGSNFFRFPAFSLTAAPVGGFGSVDTTNIEGVAGKYRGGFGTPFDLDLLTGTQGLDLGNVGFVRLVDIVGDGSAANDLNPQSLADWLNVPLAGLPPTLAALAANAPSAIFDPYPTTGSAGFDLDAIAVLNVATVPLPGTVWMLASALGLVGTFRVRRNR